MRKDKRNHTIQILSASLLSSSMVVSMLPASVLAKEDDQQGSKTETVYSFIDEDGNVNKTIVSSWLHDDDGLQNVKEVLNLQDVENVKGDEQPQVSGKNFTWNVEGNDLYYQGTTTEKPPVSVDITYQLNGKDIKARDLKGKNGHLVMTVHLKNVDSKVVNVDGKQVKVHPTFLAGGLMDLEDNIFTDVKCDQGKIVNDGDKQFLLFAAVPGLTETLDSVGLGDLGDKLDASDDIVIEADVKDYQTPALYVGMSNEFQLDELANLDSISDLTSQMSQLFDGADQLEAGSAELADGLGT